MRREVQRHCHAIESLECRMMLTAAVARVTDGLTHAQLLSLYAAGTAEHQQAVVGTLGIVQSNLRALYAINPAGVDIGSQQFGTIQSNDGIPGVAVHTTASVATLVQSLDKLGLKMLAVNSSSHMVDGYLPLSSLVLAAKLPGVTTITSLAKDSVHSVGSAPNQADATEQVAAARSAFGVDGTGVKIGVISDSANQYNNGISDSIASGDLPGNVTILKDGMSGDTDEGRAMMEEIHDLAPGAQLYFYSGDIAQDDMVAAVNALKAAGCKIIVDDLGYTDEPMFQDGVISKAINSFVAAGGSYFSAIGNDGNSGYLHTNTQYTLTNGTTWVNWAGNGQASGETLNFTVADPVDISLQWDNPYNGDTGSASANLDVFIYDQHGNLVESSTDNNLTDGLPLEDLNTLDSGTYQMKVQLVALSGQGTTPPDMIKFVAAENGGNGVTAVQYTGTTGLRSSGYGHGAGQNTISVGAVEFASAPPYSSKFTSETFSSTGPIIYAFDASGNKLSTPVTLNKPDVSGIDGINTSFFGDTMPDDPTSLPQFYGTSAAAPNVAAIAALIDQLKPGTTQAQILTALKNSTTPLNGAATGAWNSQGGYGLVNADKALGYFGTAAVAPTVSLAAISSPRTTTVASESISFSEPVAGFGLSNLSLTFNGGANLLAGAQTLATSDQTNFTLGNLAGLTGAAGSYKLTLSPTGITGSGLALASGASVSWTNNSVITPTVVLAPVASPRTTAITNETITFNEPVTGLTAANLSLTLNGGANLLTSSQTLTSSDQTTFVLNNLTALTAGVGAYTLTLGKTGIKGSGVALASGASISWQMNGSNAAPNVALAAVTTPRSSPVNSETITFNEPVNGLTVGSFSLSRSLGANLINSAETLTTTNHVIFTLGNLTAATAVAGSYVLTLNPGGITGTGGSLSAGASISWQMTATVPITPTVALAPVATPRTTSISSESINFNEPVAGFTLANLSLTLNGGANLLSGAQALTSSDQTSFTLGNLSTLTTATGTYLLTLSPTGITGGSSSMSAGASVTWTNGVVASIPTASIGNASVTKPTSGTVPMNFTVTLSAASASAVTLQYKAVAGSASPAAGDYVAISSGALTIPAGKTTGTITITVNGNTAKNAPRTFSVDLSNPTGATIARGVGTGTILSSTPVVPIVSVPTAITFAASTTATTVLSIPVTLTAAASSNVKITYETIGGTASTGAGDYNGTADGILTILAGQKTGHILISVKRHPATTNKYFHLTLLSATNVTFGNKTVKVTLT